MSTSWFQVEGEKRDVAERLGCSNTKVYESTSLENLLNTYRSSWVEGGRGERQQHEFMLKTEKVCCGDAAGIKRFKSIRYELY